MVNYVAVLIVALVGYGIGMLWYSPALFLNAWMKGLKMKKKKDCKPTLTDIVVTLLAALVTTFVLAMFVEFAQAASFLEGLVVGFFVWLGFFAAPLLDSVVWEKKPMLVYWINVGHSLVVLLLSGGVLAVWV